MQRVFVASNPVEAQFVQSFLEAAGIAAVVRGEHLFALRGAVPITSETLPGVWVCEDEDVERAMELLSRLEARSRLRSVADEDEVGGEPDGSEWEEAGEKLG